jgi:Mrp family chromosome partitioning ATPase/capsular polysaccharide biosynthesis protein
VAQPFNAPTPDDLEGEPLEIGRYLRPLLRRWWLVVGVVVASTVLTYVYFDAKTPQYRASTTIFFKASELETFLEGSDQFGTDRSVENQASLLRTQLVARAVAKRVGFTGDPNTLLKRLTVVPRPGQDFLDLTYQDPDPRRAARLANEFVDAFIATQSLQIRRQLDRTRAAIQRQLARLPKNAGATGDQSDQLRTRLQQLDALASLPVSNAQQVARASAPGRPASPRPKRDALFAFILSLVLAVAMAFGLERFDRTLRRLEDVEPIYGMPLLSAVPHVRHVASVLDDGAQVVPQHALEAMRTLRVNLELGSIDRDLELLMVISAKPAEGKSTMVRNLALSFAEAGRRVAVVECDLRRPTLAGIFHLSEGPGLTDVLIGSVELEKALAEVPIASRLQPLALTYGRAGHDSVAASGSPEHGSVRVLRAGSTVPNAPAVLASEQIQRLLGELRESHDLVLVDSPPLLNVSDAVPILAIADAAIVVARMGKSSRDAGRQLRKALDRLPNAHVIGVVANDMRDDELAGGYYYASPYVATPQPDAPRRSA